MFSINRNVLNFERLDHLQSLQKISLVFGFSYVIFLFLLCVTYNTDTVEDQVIGDRVADLGDAKGIYMEQLDRIEYKNNLRKWTLKAESAVYSESTGKARFEKPIVNVFEDNSLKPTVIISNVANVNAKDGQIETAVLQGDVKLTNASGAVVESQLAEYYAKDSKVIFPEKATILGKGYRVQGERLIANPDTGVLDFYTNVSSFFESNANLKAFSDIPKKFNE